MELNVQMDAISAILEATRDSGSVSGSFGTVMESTHFVPGGPSIPDEQI